MGGTRSLILGRGCRKEFGAVGVSQRIWRCGWGWIYCGVGGVVWGVDGGVGCG